MEMKIVKWDFLVLGQQVKLTPDAKYPDLRGQVGDLEVLVDNNGVEVRFRNRCTFGAIETKLNDLVDFLKQWSVF